MKYQLGVPLAEAIYSDKQRALYTGNPWIEALPDSLDDKALLHLLRTTMPFDESERSLPSYERLSCIQSLSHVFIPTGINIEIARKIYFAICEGYVTRNPLSSKAYQDLSNIQNCLLARDSSFSSFGNSNANASGFCLIGDSGMGKTSAVNHALSLFPQVIVHHEYRTLPFPSRQIVWMRLECPQDASVKGLCSEFFTELDQLTNGNNFEKYAVGGRATTDQMIPQMALLAKKIGLGLLVIDEIQNLSSAKSGGAQRMKNFLVQLVNTIGIPILLVGTPPALGILNSDLMSSRRSSGQQGMTVARPMQADSIEWRTFSNGIWKYQWTSSPSPLTDEIRYKLNQLSCGNIDMAVKLYMESQRIAIMQGSKKGNEVIDESVLECAAQTDAFLHVLAILRREQTARSVPPEPAGKAKHPKNSSTDRHSISSGKNNPSKVPSATITSAKEKDDTVFTLSDFMIGDNDLF